MTTLLDTNVLIKLLDDAAEHHEWAVEELGKCKVKGPVIITDIVYCEFSMGMASQSDVDAAVSKLALERLHSSDAALFRAGVAYMEYRQKNGGKKTGVLPDFLIGATAEVMGVPLVTANARDFTTYFPTVELISP